MTQTTNDREHLAIVGDSKNTSARGAVEVFEVGEQSVLTAGVAVLPMVVEDEHQEEQIRVKDNPDAVNPDAPDDGLYVTEEEYWARWYANPYSDRDVKYEWNNGTTGG